MLLIDSVYQIMMDNSLDLWENVYNTEVFFFPPSPLDQLFKLICFDLGKTLVVSGFTSGTIKEIL